MGDRGFRAVGTAAAKGLMESDKVCSRSSGGRFGGQSEGRRSERKATGRSGEMGGHWFHGGI